MSPNTMEGPAPSHGRRSWRRAWPALACCMFNTKSPTDGPATFNRTIHAKHTRAHFICKRTLLWWKKLAFRSELSPILSPFPSLSLTLSHTHSHTHTHLTRVSYIFVPLSSVRNFQPTEASLNEPACP